MKTQATKYLLTVTVVMTVLLPRLRAQSFEPFTPYGDLTPSASSWSMIKYGGITPALYTGAMFWSLPLYTYSDPDFNIPVGLEYNYDGFRPATPSGEVGLGWALICGGVVTREVRGVPDEQDAAGFEPGYFSTNLTGYYHTVRYPFLMAHREEGYTSYTDWSVKNNRLRSDLDPIEFIMDLHEELLSTENGGMFDPFMDQPGYGGTYETTPDLFHFSVMGLTGDFCIAADTTVQVFNTNVPHGSLQVEILDVSRPDHVHQMMTVRITDQRGFQYFFGGSVASTEYAESASSDGFDQHYNWGETLVITALKLTRIVAPNGRVAVFNYTPQTQCNFSRTLSRRSVLYHFDCTTNDGYIHGDRLIPNTPLQTVRMQYYSPLESVAVNGTTVLSFGYALRAQDENDPNYFVGGWSPDYFSFTNSFSCRPAVRLSGITARNFDGETVDSITFVHGYASTGTPKMFLDGLSIRSSGTYGFQYTYRTSLPHNDERATDHWGFWNQQGFLSRTEINYNSESLYNQFTSSSIKAPNYARTTAGALNRILYPSGGSTDIEYEANEAGQLIETSLYDTPHLVNNTAGFVIGGMRVKSVIDVAGSSRDTTRFEYYNGTLLQMPDYYTHLHYDYHNNDMGYVHLDLAKFFVGCPENSPRSNFITYGAVKTVHPDHSYTLTRFRDFRSDPDRYLSTVVDTIRAFDKNIYGERNTVANIDCTLAYDDFIWNNSQNQWTISGFNKAIVEDLSLIRGKTSEVLTYDADGVLKKKEEYDYDLATVHRTDWLWFNDITRFYAVRCKCYSPLETEGRTTVYENNVGVLSREIYGYNDRGQLFYKGIIRPDGSTDAVHLRYCHASGRNNPSGLDNLVSDAVKTREEGNQVWMTAAESYTYGIPGCPRPTRILSRVFDAPQDVSLISEGDYYDVTSGQTQASLFSYNAKQRLVHAAMPGGTTVDYTWDADGRNVLSKSANGPANRTEFAWKDLVGLTGVTAPSGQAESYLYDDRNRLWKTLDGDSHPVSVFHYKLRNQ